MAEEKRFVGIVGWRLYWRYFKSGGGLYFFIVMFFIAFSMGIRIFVDYFIGVWISNKYNLSNSVYVGILFGLAAATMIITFVKGFLFGHYMSIVSFTIFNEFMNKLFKKNMTFFDTTPSGQILNLVTKDTDFMDRELSMFYSSFFDVTF